jgi:hypothetical protein
MIIIIFAVHSTNVSYIFLQYVTNFLETIYRAANSSHFVNAKLEGVSDRLK